MYYTTCVVAWLFFRCFDYRLYNCKAVMSNDKRSRHSILHTDCEEDRHLHIHVRCLRRKLVNTYVREAQCIRTLYLTVDACLADGLTHIHTHAHTPRMHTSTSTHTHGVGGGGGDQLGHLILQLTCIYVHDYTHS